MRRSVTGTLRIVVIAAWMLALSMGASAEFRGDFRATPLITEARAGPNDAVDFAVDIENREEVAARFLFAATSGDGLGREGFAASAPGPLVLGPIGLDKHTETVHLVVYTPSRNGYTDDERTVRMLITSSEAFGPIDPANSAELTFVVHAQGWHVPGPSALVALLTLGVVALAPRPAWPRR